MKMKMRENKILSKEIFKGRVIKVTVDDVLCPNGAISKREIVHHNGGACVLAITKEDEVILIEQYRYAYDEILLELPAGKLEKNEDPKEAAIREFEEETGYKALEVFDLGMMYPTCGYSNEIIYLYYVSSFEKGEINLDEDEVVITKKIKFDEVLELIRKNKIKDGKTIVAVTNYLLKYR